MRLCTAILAIISLELNFEFKSDTAISGKCQLIGFVAFICGPIKILQTYSEFSQNCHSITQYKNFMGRPIVVMKTMGKFE